MHKVILLLLSLFAFSAYKLFPYCDPPSDPIPNFLTLPYTEGAINLQQGWFYNDGGTHEGIDYVNGEIDNSGSWQPFIIAASEEGEAFYRPGYNCGWGNVVILRHPPVSGITYYTAYAHLASSPLPVEDCTSVSRGETIGLAGATVCTEPP